MELMPTNFWLTTQDDMYNEIFDALETAQFAKKRKRDVEEEDILLQMTDLNDNIKLTLKEQIKLLS